MAMRLDLRHECARDHRKTRRDAHGLTIQRDVRKISAVVLHQTDVEFGLTKQQIAASGGDSSLALGRRGLDVACHAIAFRSGLAVLTHPVRDFVHHGNGFNAYSLGLEVDGRYPGLESDPRHTMGGADRTPTPLTALTIETACDALRWLVETARSEGCPIEFLYAHRQSSATRRRDPGEGLWKAVALPMAVELGLEVQWDVAIGDGRPVPREWDPRSSERY